MALALSQVMLALALVLPGKTVGARVTCSSSSSASKSGNNATTSASSATPVQSGAGLAENRKAVV